MIRLSDIAEAPIGTFRPIKVEFMCDCGGLFCERLERVTSETVSYVDIHHEAVTLGWLETGNRNLAPGCR